MLTIFLGRELEVNLCGSEASIAPAIGVAAKWWWSPGQGRTSGGQPSRGFRDRPQRDWILFREIDAFRESGTSGRPPAAGRGPRPPSKEMNFF